MEMGRKREGQRGREGERERRREVERERGSEGERRGGAGGVRVLYNSTTWSNKSHGYCTFYFFVLIVAVCALSRRHGFRRPSLGPFSSSPIISHHHPSSFIITHHHPSSLIKQRPDGLWRPPLRLRVVHQSLEHFHPLDGWQQRVHQRVVQAGGDLVILHSRVELA